MNPVLKIVLGSLARHWLGVLLGLYGGEALAGNHAQIVNSLTDDMVAHFVISLSIAIFPATLSFWRSMRLRMRERLALRMHHGAHEHEVSAIIAEAPRHRRWLAILTANPLRL